MTTRPARPTRPPEPPPLASFFVGPGVSAEPVAIGLAIPKGRLAGPGRVVDADGAAVPAGLEPLHRWPDGSVAWLLVELIVPPEGGRFRVEARPSSASAPPPVRPEPLLPGGASVSVCLNGKTGNPTFTEVDRRSNAVATLGTGRARYGPLSLELRTTAWPGLGVHRLEIVVHNPRAARHRGGLWDLGDPGSVLLDDVSFYLPRAPDDRLDAPAMQPAPGATAFPARPGEPLFQASSGGEHWACANHVEADGRVHLAFRGWRAGVRSGLRANPVLAAGGLRLALTEFWQQFPKTIGVTADGAALRLGLFPREHPGGHELQGGERKRHTVWLSMTGADLAFVAAPRRAVQPAAEVAAADVLPGFSLPEADPPEAAELARIVVDPVRGFVARRELIDEYGWRHYGDLYADHEAVGAPDDGPFISHYNNQYDGVEACLLWFLRTGDVRWFDIADPLARHVVDIDLYHTQRDRPAYAGGQFWHTDHYRPARTATHRCYARLNAGAGAYGGGPGNEQNYPSGLWLYHLLTGDPWARAAGLQLAEWVHAMDDGTRTIFAAVDSGPTGLASQTYSADFHGPGRGAGNSLNALVDAWRFTGDRRHLGLAEALIRRCVHPAQDLEGLELLDAERRWSYVVFLKYLTKYLFAKLDAGEQDAAFAYGRGALLHYIRFMVAFEGPSTRYPERLEFVTETWPAQDLRKAQVVHHAAAFAAPADRARLHAWADAMFASALAELRGHPTADRCRPLVLLLHPTIVQAHARQPRTGDALASGPTDSIAATAHETPPFVPFIPQKQRVRARVRSPAGLAAAARRVASPTGLRPLLAAARTLILE
ncbi:hypothetical protein L6V77_10260 [Myxococcota bacterium]|nr:hypothetical protein [Myxococcota bacterium]